MNLKNRLHYLLLFCLVLISFRLYSSRFYPLLGSDDALNILMTFYYKLPQDLYCWGQDRGGTLIPLISQFFHGLPGISAVNSVSISNYLVLIVGYIGFSSLFKNNFVKVLFAIIWFFPPIRFIELTRYPLGVQYSLIGFSILLIDKIQFTQKKDLRNYILLLLTILILSISIWVSDLAIVNIALLIITLLFFEFRKKGKLRINKALYFIVISSIIAVFFLLRYAKTFATKKSAGYTAFNDWDQVYQTLMIVKNRLIEILTFKNEDFLLSIYAILVIGIIVFSIIMLINKRIVIPGKVKPWLTFFLLDFFGIFSVLVFSKWVFQNGVGFWYFVPLYISLSIAILLLIDNLNLKFRQSTSIIIILYLSVIIGSLSTVYHLKYIRPKTLRPKIDIRREFLTLGEIGIIGDFWNSYITACPDPAKIKATPYEGAEKNKKRVEEVFEQPNIYVIRDMWMESFPDTINQFGRRLVREGNSFHLGDCVVNRYKLLIKQN